MPLDSSILAKPTNNSPIRSPEEIDAHQRLLEKWIQSKNIATDGDLDDWQLQKIGMRCKSEYEIDYLSCSQFREKYKEFLDFALQYAEEKTYPWPQASNVIFPLITTASVQFAARAYPAIVNGPLIVKGIVVGTDHGNPVIDPTTGQQAMGPQGPMWQIPPGIKRIRANHIAKHMSWQLLYEQKEWEGDTDKLLHLLPIVGCVFRKSYFDPTLGRNCSDLVTADKLVINYHAKSFDTAPRLTEEVLLYPVEVQELIRAGIFVDQVYLSSGQGEHVDAGDDDAPIEFLEQHRRLDLDDDGYAEPYIVTIHKSSSKVARIVARYDATGVLFSEVTNRIVKIIPVQYYTKYDFLPSPDGGIYGTGFGRLLSPINAAINTTLNQLIDAGHLQIRGGGFIGKGLSMNTGNVRFAMGEYKAVNVSGGILRDNLVPLTFPGPSQVLFQLLGLLIEAGKEVASVKDVLSGDITQANVPATTTMALIEQGLKVFSSIYKRIYRSLTSEFDKLYRLNSIYLPQESSYRYGDEWHYIKRTDYDSQSGVEPVGDPSKVADAQRLSRAQFLLTFLQSPNVNPIEILNRVFDEAQIPNYEQLLIQNPPPNPAILAKISEVASKAARDRAGEVRDIAQAMLYMAQARKLSDDAHLAWFDQQLETFRMHLEQANMQQDAINAQQGGGGGPESSGGSEENTLQNNGPTQMVPPVPLPSGTPHPHTMPQAAHALNPAPPAHGLNPNHFDPLQHMPPIPSAVTPSLWQSALGQGPQLPPNARQGKDGNWYVPDLHRGPGKYLMIMPHG
jgi:chaperonin GroES